MDLSIIIYFILSFCLYSSVNPSPEKEILLPNIVQNGGCGQNVYLAMKLNEDCEQGVLICYPSNLDAKSIDMQKLSRRFQLAPGKFENCKNGENGILAQIITSDEGQKMIHFKGSIGFSFSLKVGGNLILRLRGRRNLISMLQYQNYVQLDELSDHYVGESKNGNGATFLEDYAGRWLLGLDMIPLENSKTKITYQNLCANEMDAWNVTITNDDHFTYKTDFVTSTNAITHDDHTTFETTFATSTNTSTTNNQTTSHFISTNSTSISMPVHSISTRKSLLTSPEFTQNSSKFKNLVKNIWSYLNTSFDPCEDFYRFSCDKSKPERFSKDIIALIQELKSNNSTETESETEKMTKKAYNICLTERIQHHSHLPDESSQIYSEFMRQFGGMPAIEGEKWESPFAKMDEPERSFNFWKIIGQLEGQSEIHAFIGSSFQPEYEPAVRNVLVLTQPQKPSPPRRVFLEKALFKMLKEAQLKIQLDFKKILPLYGFEIKPALNKYITNVVSEMMELQKKMALAMVPQEMFYDLRPYEKHKLSELPVAYPSINWNGLFEGMGILKILEESDQKYPDHYAVIIAHPSYFSFLNTTFQGRQWTENRAIFNYIGKQIIDAYRQFLNPRPAEKHKKEGKTGKKSDKNLRIAKYIMKACLQEMENLFPTGIGYMYAKSVKNREDYIDGVKNQIDLIFAAFKGMLDTLKWITQDSKEKAQDKLNKMEKIIGWPRDLYGDFKSINKQIDQDQNEYTKMNLEKTWFANYRQLQKAKQATVIKKAIIQPKRTDFVVSPLYENAFYDPSTNALTITLRYLISKFKIGYPNWYNFASLGFVVGHELSHGFDSIGMQFGPLGEATCIQSRCGWMDRNSTEGFNQMTQCLIDHYSKQCCPLEKGPVRCADGKFTQSENTADIAGLQAVYNAYKQVVLNDETIMELEQQFTKNELFWIAYSRHWCAKYSEELLSRKLLTDVHSPNSCRVNQVLQNIPDFGKDFKCKEGSRMFPESAKRCKVWTGI